ncbi:MAG: NfeD family protein [Eubacterium sp.]
MVIWLVILAIMILIEVVTMGLTTVWFALGSLGAAVVTGLGGGFWLQFVVFVILSFLSMIVFRPIAMRYFNPAKEKTNIDEVIGKKAVVIEKIDNLHGTGKVRYQGIEWTARSEKENDIIENDTEVVITDVKGVKLMVKTS